MLGLSPDDENFRDAVRQVGSLIEGPALYSRATARQNLIIEAEAIGVHATPLADFVGKSARLLLIKPQGATAETRAAAVAKARARIGRPYDFLGLVGLDQAERYYCSELALSVFPRTAAGNPRPWVVPPGQLWHWGRIVYDSGPTP